MPVTSTHHSMEPFPSAESSGKGGGEGGREFAASPRYWSDTPVSQCSNPLGIRFPEYDLMPGGIRSPAYCGFKRRGWVYRWQKRIGTELGRMQTQIWKWKSRYRMTSVETVTLGALPYAHASSFTHACRYAWLIYYFSFPSFIHFLYFLLLHSNCQMSCTQLLSLREFRFGANPLNFQG